MILRLFGYDGIAWLECGGSWYRGEPLGSGDRLFPLDFGKITGFQQAAHGGKEFLPCKWFSDEGDAVFGRVPGAGHQKRCRGRRQVLDRAHQLGPAHSRHHYIGDDQLDGIRRFGECL